MDRRLLKTKVFMHLKVWNHKTPTIYWQMDQMLLKTKVFIRLKGWNHKTPVITNKWTERIASQLFCAGWLMPTKVSFRCRRTTLLLLSPPLSEYWYNFQFHQLLWQYDWADAPSKVSFLCRHITLLLLSPPLPECWDSFQSHQCTKYSKFQLMCVFCCINFEISHINWKFEHISWKILNIFTH